jgi:hypothetical protein
VEEGAPMPAAPVPGRRTDGREMLETLREGGPWKREGGGRRVVFSLGGGWDAMVAYDE